jgi:hypothetical protein
MFSAVRIRTLIVDAINGMILLSIKRRFFSIKGIDRES